MRVIVEIDGGIVRRVMSDEEVIVNVLDFDTEGADENDCQTINNESAYVYQAEISQVDVEYVTTVGKQLDEFFDKKDQGL